MVPFALLALAGAPLHGYVLAGYLADLGFRRARRDPSVVYRVLRRLAEDNMVTAEWMVGEDSPPRRTYRLTPAGEAYLHERAEDLLRQAGRIAVFLDRYRVLFPARETVTPTAALSAAEEARPARHATQRRKQ